MNLGEFRAAVADEIGISSKSDGTGSEQEAADRAINRGMQRVLEDTHCYVKRTDFSDFDGTNDDWDLSSSGILDIIELYTTSGDTRYALERISVPDIIERRRLGIPTGSPTIVYAVTGMNMILFWPTPSASDILSVYHVPLPTDMTAATDDPSTATIAGIPELLHEAIFLFACSKLASGDDDQTSAQGQRYRDWYTQEIARYHKIQRARGGSRNARARVNEKRIRRPYHTNDIYPAG